MTDVAALIADMVRAGVDPEIIGRTAAALSEREPVIVGDEQAERRREKDRLRKQEKRRLRNSAESADGPSDKEAPHTPKEITSPHSPPKGGSYTPRDELARVLDAERASAVVAHRQRLGKAMTAYAAKLLAAQFAKCPDPNAAADAMIANGWQGFKPEWLESRTAPRQTAPPKQTVGQQARDELRRMMNDAPDHETRHFLESDGSSDFAGSGLARRFALSPGGRGGH